MTKLTDADREYISQVMHEIARKIGEAKESINAEYAPLDRLYKQARKIASDVLIK